MRLRWPLLQQTYFFKNLRSSFPGSVEQSAIRPLRPEFFGRVFDEKCFAVVMQHIQRFYVLIKFYDAITRLLSAWTKTIYWVSKRGLGLLLQSGLSRRKFV